MTPTGPSTPAPPRQGGLPSRPRLLRGRRRSPVAVVIGSALGVAAVAVPLLLTSGPQRAAAQVEQPVVPAAATEPQPSSGATAAPRPPAVGGPGTPAGDGRVITVVSGGLDRDYLLLPALGLRPGSPAPLLVVLHQDIGSPAAVAVNLGLDVLRRDGITLAYPAGIGGSWNAGACCGTATERDVDDVGFVDDVLRDAGRHTPIAADRSAVLGYSGGGMLLYRLLCRPHAPLVAAVEVNGSLESHCPDGAVLPDLLSLHGAKDGSVGMHRPVFVNHLGMAPRTVTSTLATITDRAGCSTRSARAGRTADLVRFTGCRGGSSVEAVIVHDAGHRWEDVGGAARSRQFLLERLRPGQPSRA